MSDRQIKARFLEILNPSSTSTSTTHQSSARIKTSSDISDQAKRLRRLVLTAGIPDEPNLPPSQPSIRARVWKLLLHVDHLDSADYLRLVDKGPSGVSTKIKNDTFRTLATDTDFKGKVREDMLIRLLEAFVWRSQEKALEMEGGLDFSYVQGMNVLSAPFLYTLPTQVEAFACFSTFIETSCPQYVQRDLRGVHRGLELLDKCLEVADPELYAHLRSKSLSAELYAFPSALTLCACTPPLDQVLKLWDFLLAFGVHLNILCVIAQLLMMRQELMESPSPMKLLRIFPPLQANSIIGITLALAKDLPEDLYKELVRHPVSG
ncbi:hypothetical protein FFLO_04503 [Filobasidium floriforme]|uniref:Rab-GAP TBC domain-containing protein n=1 Tax=Filobasidium floriforme TaxID=5210 RepID=A0A8K0JIR7_9TREE|nr:rab-GTPase-TBC domain-containing protein [Filobasidium floriforme]KAG7531261.1 hypothetical protein FFLO_04503 [Filobasidium floriforme]KAH8089678.1 rab-GTPase-TBC domain-containing protein [Filobasidium floriforme]